MPIIPAKILLGNNSRSERHKEMIFIDLFARGFRSEQKVPTLCIDGEIDKFAGRILCPFFKRRRDRIS